MIKPPQGEFMHGPHSWPPAGLPGGNPAIGWQADFTPSFTTKYVAFGKMLDVTNPPVILQINLKE